MHAPQRGRDARAVHGTQSVGEPFGVFMVIVWAFWAFAMSLQDFREPSHCFAPKMLSAVGDMHEGNSNKAKKRGLARQSSSSQLHGPRLHRQSNG